MIYSQHAFMQKQGITMITSVQAVLSRSLVIFSKLAARLANFWTPCSPLKIKQDFPLPASVSIFWSGP